MLDFAQNSPPKVHKYPTINTALLNVDQTGT